jgi:hypothetical protein
VGGARALWLGAALRAGPPGGSPRTRGRPREPDAGLRAHGARSDPQRASRDARSLRARGTDPPRGRDVSISRARRRPRALRGRGAGALLPGGDRRRDRGVGERARGNAGNGGPRGVQARSAPARRRAHPGPRRPNQPAAVVGRDPDLPLPRAARATRVDPRRGGRGRDRRSQPGAQRGLPRRAVRPRLPGALPRSGAARCPRGRASRGGRRARRCEAPSRRVAG